MRFSASAAPLLGAALLLAEATILMLSWLAPRVDENYRDFYIDRRVSCWLTDAGRRQATADLGVAHIEVKRLATADTCFLLGSGWGDVEKNWGVWSNQAVARLNLPAVPGRHVLTLRLIAFSRSNDQSVTIDVNGAPAGRFFISTANPVAPRVEVPPGDGGVTITLHIKHPAASSVWSWDGGNPRHLGIGLIALDWTSQ